MSFKKYSTVPLELIDADKEPDWVKEADEKDKEAETNSSTPAEDDSE